MPFAAPKTPERDSRKADRLAMPRHLESEILIKPRQGRSYAMLHDDLQQVEKLTQSVKSLLSDADGVLESEGLRQQLETLERCVDYYRRGIAAARIMSEYGHDWLDDMQTRLRQAVAEQHRYDGEGASNYSSLKGREGVEEPADRLASAMHHADRAQAVFGRMFTQA